MAFSDPVKNIEHLGIQEGSYIADLGAGTGFYTYAAALRTGKGGKVYAIDVNQDLLTRIKKQAHEYHLSHVEVIHGDIEKKHGTRLKDHAVDIVVLSNILFQISDEDAVCTEIHRILKPHGRLLVVDWKDSYQHTGPHPKHVVTQHSAEKLFMHHGFLKIRSFDAGHHHYGLIYNITKV